MSDVKRYTLATGIPAGIASLKAGSIVVAGSDYDALLAENERLRALSVTNIMVDVVPGYDGMGHEVYAKSVADIEQKLSAYVDQVDSLELERDSLKATLNATQIVLRQANAKFDYVEAIGEAGNQYHTRFKDAHPLPVKWRWHELWDEMVKALAKGDK